MLSQFSYPIICTDKYVQTVNFYEDYFDFSPEFEMKDFVILKRNDYEDSYIAIISSDNETLPKKYRKTVTGMILNYPVKDVRASYQQMYWEGLNIVSEPSEAPCLRKHYFVEDPNGILIDIAMDVKTKKFAAVDSINELCTENVA